MLKLRLSMGGTKKRPVYKIVVADSRFARDGRFIEKLGFFNPLLPKEKEERIGLETDRIKYWISQGAKPTTRVARILGEKQIIPMPANSNNPQKAIPKKDRKKTRKRKKQKLLRKRKKQKLLRKRKKQKLLRKRKKQKLLRKRKKQKLLRKRKKQKLLRKRKKQKLLRKRKKQKLLRKRKKQKLLRKRKNK